MIPAVAAERYFANKHHANYENYPLSKSTIGIILFSWVMGFVIAVISFFIESLSRFHSLPFCSSFVFMSRESSILLPSIQMMSQIGGITAYILAYRNSKRKLADYYGRKVHISLSGQYSLRQITDLTGAFLPVVGFNALCLLVFFVPATVSRYFVGKNVKMELEVALLTEYSGFLLQITCSSIIVLMKCNVIRQAVFGIPWIDKLARLGRRRVGQRANVNEGDVRIFHLEQIWEKTRKLAEQTRIKTNNDDLII